ncbi:MAG TPA: hypothetical protein PLC22_05790 [Gordonia sp. (in: high G+C Gram-positive bacteria)]|nr:hypothetical protein [Gordonia sp. (in: high G+C Gram-positive bacteria)]
MPTPIPECIVVFDVNVWLDAATLITQPFSWDEFDAIARSVNSLPAPHPDVRYDCLRAIAMSRTGFYDSANQRLEVWTSAHIDRLVISKALEVVRDRAGRRWTQATAEGLVEDFLYQVLDDTGGGTVGDIVVPMGNPPLDHEDGCVYRTAMDAGDDHMSRKVIVTRDRSFRQSAPSIGTFVDVVTPAEYVSELRKARRPTFPRPPFRPSEP